MTILNREGSRRYTSEAPRYAVLTIHKTKNSDPKVVVLGEGLALCELERALARGLKQADLVLATEGGHLDSQQVTFPKGAWARVQRMANLAGTSVVFHTLRHIDTSLLLPRNATLIPPSNILERLLSAGRESSTGNWSGRHLGKRADQTTKTRQGRAQRAEVAEDAWSR